MNDGKSVKKQDIVHRIQSNCETCEFYIFDGEGYICDSKLDQDEAEHFALGDTMNCPYYRYYDEYKSVQKQN